MVGFGGGDTSRRFFETYHPLCICSHKGHLYLLGRNMFLTVGELHVVLGS